VFFVDHFLCKIELLEDEGTQRILMADLTQLEELESSDIVDSLRGRFLKEGKIYTSIGDAVLLKVNPFHFDTHVVHDGPSLERLASSARERALSSCKSQSVVMTGESGSGKTEATKTYIGELVNNDTFCKDRSFQIQLMDAAVLLESFGNCATPHNGNSSRFARYFELRMDMPSRQVVSANVTSYLLEKSRLVTGSSDASNFHVFYDLCGTLGSIASAIEKPASEFRYLDNRINSFREGRYDSMEQQLIRLNATEGEIECLAKLLWGILHLGNIDFVRDGFGSTVSNSTSNSASIVTELLGLADNSLLHQMLCQKKLVVGKEFVWKEQTVEQSYAVRDSLAKCLYDQLFTWVVSLINCHVGKLSTQETHNTVSIGVLDIFGFECFENNSFEQLCINYANEALVELFHEVLVANEIKICLEEGVPLSEIGLSGDYLSMTGNNVRTSLAQVFTLIHDEVRVPRSTDLTLSSKLVKMHGSGPTKKYYGNIPAFKIEHYAGPVHYNLNSWLEKSRDSAPVDILTVLVEQSCCSFLVQILSRNFSPETISKSKKVQTIGEKFRDEFSKLALDLQTRDQQFVICLKSNKSNAKQTFDDAAVLRQLECNGVLAICNVRKKAFAAHMLHDTFLAKYSILQFKDIATLVRGTQIQPHTFVGTSRVLLRREAINELRVRVAVVEVSIILVQRNFRIYLARLHYGIVRSKVIQLQSFFRGRFQITKYARAFRLHTAAKLLQSVFRVFLVQRRLQSKYEMAVVVQACFRRYRIWPSRIALKVRMAFVETRTKTMIDNLSATMIQRVARNYIARNFEFETMERNIKKLKIVFMSASIIQSFFRRYVAFGRSEEAIYEKMLAAIALANVGTAVVSPRVLSPIDDAESSFGFEKQEPTSEIPDVQHDDQPFEIQKEFAVSENSIDVDGSLNTVLLSRAIIPRGKRRNPNASLVVAVESIQPEVFSVASMGSDERPASAGRLEGNGVPYSRNSLPDVLSYREDKKQITSFLKLQSSSSEFLYHEGKSEDTYYEEKARSSFEFNYLLPENEKFAAPKKKFKVEFCKKVLEEALYSRDMSALLRARNVACAMNYQGSELSKAEAVIAHIRTIHMRQLEAERLLSELHQ